MKGQRSEGSPANNNGRGFLTASEACETINTTGILTSQKRSEHLRSCAGSQTDPSTDTEQHFTVCATPLHADRTRASQSIFTTRTARRHWHGIARRQSSRPAQSQEAWPNSTHNANAVRQRVHTPCRQMRARKHGCERDLRRTLRDSHAAAGACGVYFLHIEPLHAEMRPASHPHDYLGLRTAF